MVRSPCSKGLSCEHAYNTLFGIRTRVDRMSVPWTVLYQQDGIRNSTHQLFIPRGVTKPCLVLQTASVTSTDLTQSYTAIKKQPTRHNMLNFAYASLQFIPTQIDRHLLCLKFLLTSLDL